ncbi:hypothetical protein GCM10027284_42140 [Cyclobacterium sediminis]
MSKKIGRNDKCPCGSGKKYKKCCLNKGLTLVKPEGTYKQHIFAEFNLEFLLDWFGTASLLPVNHGKNIRLEIIIREALLHANKDAGSTDKKKLEALLNQYYEHHHLEDPPVNLFTELITFYGGDYLVLPGISDSGVLILSTILNSIFHLKNSLPDKFKGLVYDSTSFMLGMSDFCIKQSGLIRYEPGTPDDNEIILGESNLHDSLIITDEKIMEIGALYNVQPETLQLFCLGEDADLSNSDPDKNPMIPRPLQKINGGYRILSPANIHVALLHAVIEFAIIFDCLPELIDLYIEIVWNNSLSHLYSSHYAVISDEFELERPDSFKHGVFRFDLDKIAYVVLSYDDGNKYDRRHPYFSTHIGKEDEYDKVTSATLNKIKEHYPDGKVLLIRLSAGLGRQYLQSYKKVEGVNILNFSVNEFDLLMKARDYDSLSLWNFSEAKSRFLSKVEIPPSQSDLDFYALYKDKKDSFYMNDDALPSMLWLAPGYSASFIKEVVQNEDIHSIERLNNKGELGVIPCVKVKGSSNIYYPISYIGNKLIHAVEGYIHPIWIEFAGDLRKVDSQFRGVYIEMLDAISYWIWQITSTAQNPIDHIIHSPFTITFDFIDRSKFENIEPVFKREPGLIDLFQVEICTNGLLFKIPDQITPYLYGSDNEGEQILVRALLNGFRQFDEANKKTRALTEDLIDSIIAENVPLGLKKKIFVLTTENEIKLDPRGLKGHRYIQEYNIGIILDEIVPKALVGGYLSPDTKDIEDGYKFIRNLVTRILLPWLDSKIEKLDCEDLLSRLIVLNEALVRKRTDAILKTPTRIACFVTEEQQITELNNSLKNIDQTSLSTRCLIEHIAACPSEGEKIASKSDLDELLALMEQIISWGMQGDLINFGVSENKIDVLDSQRIGTDHTLDEEVFNPFRLAKTKENVTDAITEFNDNFSEKNYSGNTGVSKKTDKAFEEEFGVTLTGILGFSHFLIWLAFETDPGYTKIYQMEMKEQAKKFFKDLSDYEFNALISYYCLDKRKSLMDLPKGYYPYDVFPWRYNRGLALIRKPIVRRFDEEKKDFLCHYGPRQTKIAATQTLYLFYTGKLRCIDGGSLSKIIGEKLNRKGAEFTKTVYDYFKALDGERIVDQEVPIKNNKFLKADKDLGDIDVLVIDHELKGILLLECKKTEVARNVKQMVEEVNNLFGSESDKGWIVKHEARFGWVKENVALLSEKYDLDLSGYTVIPVILTSEELPTKYLKEKDLPFDMLSFYQIKPWLINQKKIMSLND